MIVATIRNGYTIKLDGQNYTVIGSRKLRREYFYILRDANGDKSSIRREHMLAGQAEGRIRVAA